MGPDLARWQIWWEYNKDPYIRLKESLWRSAVTGSDEFFMGGTRRKRGRDVLRPTPDEAVAQVLPALKRALESGDGRDVESSCLVAIAKIGRDHENFKIVPLLSGWLKSDDQEARETAALALGITARTEALPTLLSLARDDAEGRAACRRGEVDYRIGDETYSLRAGDSLHFKTTLPHSWINNGTGPAQLLLVVTLPDKLKTLFHRRLREAAAPAATAKPSGDA